MYIKIVFGEIFSPKTTKGGKIKVGWIEGVPTILPGSFHFSQSKKDNFLILRSLRSPMWFKSHGFFDCFQWVYSVCSYGCCPVQLASTGRSN